jgi:ketosteroid isomerase-like protein
MRLASIVAAFSFTMLGSALLAQQPAGTAPNQLPSITLAPELNRVLRDYEAAWRKSDAAALSELFSEDGFVLQSGKPPARGRAAIKAVYQGQGGALRLRALAVVTADTVGYIIGAYGYGNDTTDMGKFTLTLKRPRGGKWLIFSDMDNGNRAPR